MSEGNSRMQTRLWRIVDQVPRTCRHLLQQKAFMPMDHRPYYVRINVRVMTPINAEFGKQRVRQLRQRRSLNRLRLRSTAGGTFVNGGVPHHNPAELALLEAQRIWSTGKRFCVVSVGTGRPRSVKIVEVISRQSAHSKMTTFRLVRKTTSRVAA